MDDCSPDQTAQVARSFRDQRITYVRNEHNLGHLANYNKGIALAAGAYVWLISADDKLIKPNALERYIDLMAMRPEVGYVFSSGVFLRNGTEGELIRDSWWGDRDFISRGQKFFARFYRGEANIVCPSCLVRKDCYDLLGMFPLDMPHAGDRYLWNLWALTYDVAHFAEPMVAYRLHDFNIMNTLRNSGTVIADLLRWQIRIRDKARASGHAPLVSSWISNVANLYAFALLSERFGASAHRMTFAELDDSLRQHFGGGRDEGRLRSRIYAGFADGCYSRGSIDEARHFYRLALKTYPLALKPWIKYVLLLTGRPGLLLRRWLRSATTSGATGTQ